MQYTGSCPYVFTVREILYAFANLQQCNIIVKDWKLQ